jgi:hypothetical protein
MPEFDIPFRSDPCAWRRNRPSPMGQVSGVRYDSSAVLYLRVSSQLTGEVLHVDSAAHFGE